jgi:integrase
VLGLPLRAVGTAEALLDQVQQVQAVDRPVRVVGLHPREWLGQLRQIGGQPLVGHRGPAFLQQGHQGVDELCVLVAAIPPTWRPMVFVDLLTGLRWGEITAWRWADLHLGVGKASVWQNIPVGERVPGSTKGGAQRVVDLFPAVVNVLMDVPQRGQLVFPGTRGGRLSYGWFRRQTWEPAMERAELNLTFHDLRHGFAGLLLAFGYAILYVSQQLGHSSAKITLDTYGHIMEEGHRLDRGFTLRKLEEAYRGATRVLPNQNFAEGAKAKTIDWTGAGDEIRTRDLRITSALLYH